MGKRKSTHDDGSSSQVAVIRSLVDMVQNHLNYLPSNVKREVETTLENLTLPQVPIVTHQATEYFDTGEAATALGVDFDEYSPTHMLSLKKISNDKTLRSDTASVLQRLHASPYTRHRRLETITRTMLDLIFLDRLESLDDRYAYHHLFLKPEVPISTFVDTVDGREEIKGRLDWALNYEIKKGVKPGSILVVWEAKRMGHALTGLPQLLVYMTGVLESRRDRINQTVFGVLSDSGNFTFAFVDDQRKFYVSKPYSWAADQSAILSYIDAIFEDAIQSSPHTTPVKAGNTVLFNYKEYLNKRWMFGIEPKNMAVPDVALESVVDEGQDMFGIGPENMAVPDVAPESVVDVGPDMVLRPANMGA